jgi:hypothetical protein
LECGNNATSRVVVGVGEVLYELGLANSGSDDTAIIAEEETFIDQYVRGYSRE